MLFLLNTLLYIKNIIHINYINIGTIYQQAIIIFIPVLKYKFYKIIYLLLYFNFHSDNMKPCQTNLKYKNVKKTHKTYIKNIIVNLLFCNVT